MRQLLKSILQRLKLLGTARAVVYWFTRFDPNSTYPRRMRVRFYSQFIREGDLCFDVGANVGNRTIVFLELGAKVICIEPQQSCLNRLYKLFSNNKNVNIVAKGVADREGFLELSVCEETPVISTMSEKFKKESRFIEEGYEYTKVEKVPVTTLDLLISQYGMPTFCKIDVEGFEERALKGLSKPISLISFEFQAEFLDDIKACMNRLLQIGNYRFNFGTWEPTVNRGLLLPEWVDANELYNKLKVFLKAEDPSLQSWGDIYAKLF